VIDSQVYNAGIYNKKKDIKLTKMAVTWSIENVGQRLIREGNVKMPGLADTGLSYIKEDNNVFTEQEKTSSGWTSTSTTETTQPQGSVEYNYNPTNVSEEVRNNNKQYVLDKLGRPSSINFETREGDTLYKFTFSDGIVIETPAKGKMLSFPKMSEKIVELSKEDTGYDIKFLIGLNKLAEETTQLQKDDVRLPYYEGKITSLKPNQVFVFGSNPEGRHGAGAAKYARDNFGAVYGQGEGLQGQSYALPTKDLRVKENRGLRSISPEQITNSIADLYQVASDNSNKEFLVSDYSGKNLNGYTGQEMAEMFVEAGKIPNNIVFNKNFLTLVNEEVKKKCQGRGGSPKAKDGAQFGFTPGSKWQVIKNFKGNSHKEGGIDINISNSGIKMSRKNGKFEAKNGVVINSKSLKK
jgi:hypothetical protein